MKQTMPDDEEPKKKFLCGGKSKKKKKKKKLYNANASGESLGSLTSRPQSWLLHS